MTNLEKEIERAIRETLVVENKKGIPFAVKAILKAITLNEKKIHDEQN